MSAPVGPSPSLRGRGAVIFDRDGVLNVDIGYAYRPDQIAWVEDAAKAVRAVNAAGLLAFVATNQSGVARGLYSEADVRGLHAWMNAELARDGARIDDFAYCPHHPEGVVDAYRRVCACRKPGPEMILDLMRRWGADPARSVMIGDKSSDLDAATAAGVAGLPFKGGSLLRAVRPALARLAAMTGE